MTNCYRVLLFNPVYCHCWSMKSHVLSEDEKMKAVHLHAMGFNMIGLLSPKAFKTRFPDTIFSSNWGHYARLFCLCWHKLTVCMGTNLVWRDPYIIFICQMTKLVNSCMNEKTFSFCLFFPYHFFMSCSWTPMVYWRINKLTHWVIIGWGKYRQLFSARPSFKYTIPRRQQKPHT